MALNYDFDMVLATPETRAEGAASDTGQPPTAQPPTGLAVAVFRDPATVAALKRAPQGMQNYLRASHFGFGSHHSGAPDGHYPKTDEAARITVIEALAENVARFDLPAADDMQPSDTAFHLPAFFAAVAEAEPVHVDPAPEVQPVQTETIAAPEARSADTILADAIADPAVAADTADAPATQPTEADATTVPTPARRRFRIPALPSLPRWLTSGAALTVLGVARPR